MPCSVCGEMDRKCCVPAAPKRAPKVKAKIKPNTKTFWLVTFQERILTGEWVSEKYLYDTKEECETLIAGYRSRAIRSVKIHKIEVEL